MHARGSSKRIGPTDYDETASMQDRIDAYLEGRQEVVLTIRTTETFRPRRSDPALFISDSSESSRSRRPSLEFGPGSLGYRESESPGKSPSTGSPFSVTPEPFSSAGGLMFSVL